MVGLGKELRNLRGVCYDHLRRANDIYRSQAPDKDKQASWNALIAEMESCRRCQRLRSGKTTLAIMNPHSTPSWQGAKLVESWPYDSVEFRSLPDARRRAFEEKGLFPSSVLESRLKDNLHQIEPAERNARPAMATLADGFVLPRVIFADEDYVFRWHTPFWRNFVRADKVVDIGESPFKMSLPVLTKLMSVGETSMSTLEFRVLLRNGERVPCCYSGYNPFIELPAPHRPIDIVDVEIGRGLVTGEEAVLDEPDFVWCVYR